jgi:epsin
MLRQFHFIDQNGKDQGINVRNRAKELAELLSDVEKIRSERKKARANRSKYGGYEGGSMGMSSSGMGGSSNFSGFGSESAGYGGYMGGVYGDGGGFGGNEVEFGATTSSGRDRFQEYDEYDEGEVAPPGRRKADEPSSPRVKREAKKPEPAKPKQPEVDLFSFDDPEPAPSTSNGKAAVTSDLGALQSSTAEEDDDFDDFQSATPTAAANTSSFSIQPPASTSTTTSATQFAQPKPVSGSQGQNLNDIFNTVSPPPPPARTNTTSSISSVPNYTPGTTMASTPSAAFKSPPVPQNYQPTQPNYFTSVSVQPTQAAGSGTSTPSNTFANLGKPTSKPMVGGAKKAAGGADPFASLVGGIGSSKQTQGGARMADMAKQKSSAGLWGAPTTGSGASTPQPASQQPQQKIGGGLEDLLG